MSKFGTTVIEYKARKEFRIFEKYPSIFYVKMYKIILLPFRNVGLRESAIPVNVIKV